MLYFLLLIAFTTFAVFLFHFLHLFTLGRKPTKLCIFPLLIVHFALVCMCVMIESFNFLLLPLGTLAWHMLAALTLAWRYIAMCSSLFECRAPKTYRWRHSWSRCIVVQCVVLFALQSSRTWGQLASGVQKNNNLISISDWSI